MEAATCAVVQVYSDHQLLPEDALGSHEEFRVSQAGWMKKLLRENMKQHLFIIYYGLLLFSY